MTSLAPSDLDLLEIQIEALFTHDPDGRIVSINEPGGGPAPRFFFGRTRTGNLWRIRHDVPEDTARRLEELAASEPVQDDLMSMPRNLDAFLETLGRNREAAMGHAGPAWRFPEAPPAPMNVTLITYENRHLLWGLMPYLRDIEQGLVDYEPRVVVVEDGLAVAICNSARITDRAAEAGVETLAAYRGQGYASAVVAAWADVVRDSGRIPLYSTSWDNLASQAVARKLGLIQYAADLSVE